MYRALPVPRGKPYLVVNPDRGRSIDRSSLDVLSPIAISRIISKKYSSRADDLLRRCREAISVFFYTYGRTRAIRWRSRNTTRHTVGEVSGESRPRTEDAKVFGGGSNVSSLWDQPREREH